MEKYIKRTPQAVVEAFKWTPETAKVEDCVAKETYTEDGETKHFGTVISSRGQLRVNPGDYVITLPRDASGMPDFDVKNPKDFAEQYMRVEDAEKPKR